MRDFARFGALVSQPSKAINPICEFFIQVDSLLGAQLSQDLIIKRNPSRITFRAGFWRRDEPALHVLEAAWQSHPLLKLRYKTIPLFPSFAATFGAGVDSFLESVTPARSLSLFDITNPIFDE